MYLTKVVDFLKTMPNFSMSTDGKEIYCACPWCDFDLSNPRSHHMAVKIDVEPNETMVYHCFRSSLPRIRHIEDIIITEIRLYRYGNDFGISKTQCVDIQVDRSIYTKKETRVIGTQYQ